MARRQAPAGGDRGGGAIQATRSERARVALPVATLGLGLAAAAWPALAGQRGADAVLLLVGGAGWALLAVALALRVVTLVGPALAVFGVVYALSLGAGIDGRAPLFAGLLLLVAELAYWSLELRVPLVAEPGTLRLRNVAVIAMVGAAVVLAAALLALTAIPGLTGGVAWEVVGVLAAGGALALVVALARPRPG